MSQTCQTTDLHKPPEGVRVDLDGRQRRDAPCGSVADQRGKHEINGCRSSIQLRWGGWWRRGRHKCAACLKEGSNNGAKGPADDHQLAIRGLRLSEDRLPFREAARRMI